MRHAGQQLDNSTLILRGFFAAPPTFTETPPQYIEAKEGGSITMTCTAFGNPKPIVTWLKEGTLLAASGKYRVSVVLCWGHCTPLTLPLLVFPLQGSLPLYVTSDTLCKGTEGKWK